MEYKVLNFPASNDPAKSLLTQINKEKANGYRYVSHQYCDKLAGGSAGCFGFNSSPPVPTHIGFIVFIKE
jgi:hypothetical protein